MVKRWSHYPAAPGGYRVFSIQSWIFRYTWLSCHINFNQIFAFYNRWRMYGSADIIIVVMDLASRVDAGFFYLYLTK